MESTQKFVKEVHDQQESNNKSKERNSKENSGHKLPGKQHSTNK